MRTRIGEFADRTALPVEELLEAAHPPEADLVLRCAIPSPVADPRLAVGDPT